jgi:PAS domain-containing protein
MKIRAHLFFLVFAALLPILLFSVALTALFWHEQRSVALVAAAGATVALLLSIALAWVLGKRIARAVSGLASVARGLATAQPAPPVPAGNIAEVNETANALAETRKQLQARERQLRESEEKFRTLTTHAPVGIFLSDLKGDYYFVNRTWCTVSKMTVEEAKGRGWQRALHQLRVSLSATQRDRHLASG